MSNQIDFNDDLLLQEASQYYGSVGFRNRMTEVVFDSIINGPYFNSDGSVSLASVFRFALDHHFKKSQMYYERPLGY